MRIIMTGGGSGGHINPALAIASHMKEKYPDTEILFVGTERGLESELVPKAGFDIKYIPASGLKRKLTFENFKIIKNLIDGSKESGKIIEDFKPDIIIGTGGYVSFTTIREGCKRGIHTLIHEANSVAGLANKVLAKDVDKIAVSFEATYKDFGNSPKIVYTGNPLSKDILENAEKRDFDEVYSRETYTVLVTGGSQGAQKINKAIEELLIINEGKLPYKLIFATGKLNYDKFIKTMDEKWVDIKNKKNIEIKPYIFDMGNQMRNANLMVGRCGAMTVSEISAIGVPAILVPLPIADKNYQELNAFELEDKDTARVILDDELDGEILDKTIKELLGDRQKLKEMALKSYQIGKRDALEKIEQTILELVK